MALSDTEIRKAKPTDKRQRLSDGGGMYLEIATTGSKLWRLKFRFDGKEKLLALGVYPDVSLKVARKRRDEARQQVADGVDPTAVRKTARRARKVAALNTLEATARAWLDHRADSWVERTRTVILASLENDVFPILGARPIADLQPVDVRNLVQGIEARGAGETAGRVFQRLRSMPYSISQRPAANAVMNPRPSARA